MTSADTTSTPPSSILTPLLDPSRPDAKPAHRAFPNTPAGFERLHEWLGDRQVHACIEATNTYGDALARSLHGRGHTVSVVNPAKVMAFAGTLATRAKTDKADAALIARFCALHRPAPWTPPLPEVAELQALVRRLEALQEMRRMEENRRDTAPAALHADLEGHIAFLGGQIDRTRKAISDHIDRTRKAISDHIDRTRKAISDHIDNTPTLKKQSDLLVTVPGIAGTTAAAILAEIGDARQFASARQVVAFAGLDPKVRQSGTSVRGRACLSKAGSPRLRRALYFPALAALRFNPAVAALRERLLVAGKVRKLIVGAAMRKLLQIAFGVLKSGRPFDPAVCMAEPPAKQEQRLALAA